MNLVAADVSPLHLKPEEVRADSRPLLRFKGSMRELGLENPFPVRGGEGGIHSRWSTSCAPQ